MHQCLGCGYIVPPDDTSMLLQGCPDCKGTRFFYTEAKVDAPAREKLAANQKDLRQVVTEMLQETDPDGDWAELRPRDLRRLVKKANERVPVWENPEVEPLGMDTATSRKEAADRVEEARRASKARPDTVEAGDGSYSIDVEGLLDHNPIVVHKDGAYLIHLPSLFDQK